MLMSRNFFLVNLVVISMVAGVGTAQAEEEPAVAALRQELLQERTRLGNEETFINQLEKTRRQIIALNAQIQALSSRHEEILAIFSQQLESISAMRQRLTVITPVVAQQLKDMTSYVNDFMIGLKAAQASLDLPADFSERYDIWTSDGGLCRNHEAQRIATKLAEIATEVLPSLVAQHKRLVADANLPSTHAAIKDGFLAANNQLASAAKKVTEGAYALNEFSQEPPVCSVVKNLALMVSLKASLLRVNASTNELKTMEDQLVAVLAGNLQALNAIEFAKAVRRTSTSAQAEVIAFITASKATEAYEASQRSLQAIALLGEQVARAPLPATDSESLKKHLDEAEADIYARSLRSLQSGKGMRALIFQRTKTLRLKIQAGLVNAQGAKLMQLTALKERLRQETGIALTGLLRLPEFEERQDAMNFDSKIASIEASAAAALAL